MENTIDCTFELEGSFREKGDTNNTDLVLEKKNSISRAQNEVREFG